MSDMKKWLDLMESAVSEKKKSPAGGPTCWKGKKIHPTKPTKMKGGKRVNNCIDAGINELEEGPELSESAPQNPFGFDQQLVRATQDPRMGERFTFQADQSGNKLVSVIRGDYSYGGDQGLYELAIVVDGEVQGDPKGYLSVDDVKQMLSTHLPNKATEQFDEGEVVDRYKKKKEQERKGSTKKVSMKKVQKKKQEHGDREDLRHKKNELQWGKKRMDQLGKTQDRLHRQKYDKHQQWNEDVEQFDESYPTAPYGEPKDTTNVSFNQSKKIGDATLNINAQAKDMAELQKVLQMAGLDPEGAEKHMPEPDSVQVVDVEPVEEPGDTGCGCDGDDTMGYSTNKTELIDMLRNRLQRKLD